MAKKNTEHFSSKRTKTNPQKLKAHKKPFYRGLLGSNERDETKSAQSSVGLCVRLHLHVMFTRLAWWGPIRFPGCARWARSQVTLMRVCVCVCVCVCAPVTPYLHHLTGTFCSLAPSPPAPDVTPDTDTGAALPRQPLLGLPRRRVQEALSRTRTYCQGELDGQTI